MKPTQSLKHFQVESHVGALKNVNHLLKCANLETCLQLRINKSQVAVFKHFNCLSCCVKSDITLYALLIAKLFQPISKNMYAQCIFVNK